MRNRSDWRARAWVVYLAVGSLLTLLYVTVPPLKGSGPLINVLGLSSWLAIAAGILIHKPRARTAWLLFVVGQFLFFFGDLYTYSYPKLLGAEVEFPSFGDAVYLTVYPALVAGLLVLVRRRNPGGDRSAVIDSLILTVGAALLSWVFLIAPNIHLSGLTTMEKAVSAAYPLGDILLLAAAIRLAVDAGKRAPAFYLLVASIVSLLAVDSAYTFVLLTDSYNHQLWLDVGWIAYLLLWGAAALHPSMRTLEEPALEPRTRLTAARLILLAGACLIAPGIRFAQALDDPDIIIIIVASMILFLLVVARMAGLVRQEEHAVSRELALRAAGADLVAAAGAEQVDAATVSAVRSLVGSDAQVRLVVLDDGIARVAASSGRDDAWTISRGTYTWLCGRDHAEPQELRSFPEPVRADLRLFEGRSALALPLVVREETRGMLVVCAATEVRRQLVDSLESLASQVSLALESAALAENLHRRQSEARFGSLVAHSSDLITVLDANGIVTYQSPSIERLLGYRVEEIEGTDFARLVSDVDRPRLLQIIAGIAESTGDARAIECSIRHRDGAWLQLEVRHSNLLDDEHVRGIVLNSRDISERKAFEEQLAHQAFHDPVTGLANRALFADRVQQALVRAARGGQVVGVMFIDLDDFKTVNDSLGHAAGDTVLEEVARRLEGAVRESDTVARFGGDEFAVLVDGVEDSGEAADVAMRILRELEMQLKIDGKPVYPRASVGICLAEDELRTVDAEELLRNADLAMYMAKRDSKGGYRLFEPAMHERVVARLELRGELQRALELDQLEVHYQPVVRLDEQRVYGVEALVRWTHPERGRMLPDQFVPLAEETGLIVPIGRWVLHKACRQAISLQKRQNGGEPLTMSVNLSAKQLQSESIVKDVREALRATRLDPSTLVLEITETDMMVDTDLAVRRLSALKDLGVRLAMDDFGTGYSSLSYLSRFPVDILKLDRSFLLSEDVDTGLAAAIISLGQSLKLEVIAEGVEQPEQILTLQALGCMLGQGFYFGQPMGSDELNDYLASGSVVAIGAVAQPASHAA